MTTTSAHHHVTVIGAGLSGLAAAHYASAAGYDCVVVERNGRTGGAAATITHGAFAFDLGAHRLHDKIPEVTADIRAVLGDDLQEVRAPSRIHHPDGSVGFPLSPLDVLTQLGPIGVARSVGEILVARCRPAPHDESFEQYAHRAYGRLIADRYLTNYSEKLWGRPARDLSAAVSGGRLRRLDARSLLATTLHGRRAAAHLDGAFLYPRSGGIGVLSERLEAGLRPGRLLLGTGVSSVLHDGFRVRGLVAGGRTIEAGRHVISTMPLPALVSSLEPRVPPDVELAARRLRIRSLILVALFLDRPSITTDATVYFPDAAHPFTRVSEPRNRNPRMSPAGQTSLVAELPCDEGDATWAAADERLVSDVVRHLASVGWPVSADAVIGHRVERMANAYPVMTRDTSAALNTVWAYLNRFTNLTLIGRFGRFSYSHIHDHFHEARRAVRNLTAGGTCLP